MITRQEYDWIQEQCNAFNKSTNDFHRVELEDVMFSLAYNKTYNDDNGQFFILNDWDEGEPNDPYWDKKNNRHSVISFIIETCQKFKEKFSEPAS